MHSSDPPPELQIGCYGPVLILGAALAWAAWALIRALRAALTGH